MRDPIDGRLLAIDLDDHLRILDIEIGVDVEQAVDLGDLVAQLRRDAIERLGLVRLQRVLVLALRQPAAQIDVLDRLEKDLHAGHDIRASGAAAPITTRSSPRSFFGLSAISMRPELPTVLGPPVPTVELT